MDNLKSEAGALGRKLINKEWVADAAVIAARAAIASIPNTGSAAVELFSPLLRKASERRREALLDDIGYWLDRMENDLEGFDLRVAIAQPRFESAVFRAIELCFTTHEAEKLAALRNAVLHVALDPSLDDHLCALFWKWVAELETLHILALDFFSRPQPYQTTNDPTIPPHSAGSMVDMTLLSLPQFGNRIDVSQVIIRDLIDRRLLKDDSAQLFVDLDGHRNMKPMISDLGQEFLEFISEPAFTAT